MAERTVGISEAAKLLGISSEAVRKRIKRGSLRAHKNGGGQWLVILDDTRLAAGGYNQGNGVQADAANVTTSMDSIRASTVIEDTLRDEVSILRDDIKFLREEILRLETIIMNLSQSISLSEAPQQTPLRMSWWHRLKSRFIGKQ